MKKIFKRFFLFFVIAGTFLFVCHNTIISSTLAKQNIISRDTDEKQNVSKMIAYSDGDANADEIKDKQKTEQPSWLESKIKSIKNAIISAVNIVRNSFAIKQENIKDEQNHSSNNSSAEAKKEDNVIKQSFEAEKINSASVWDAELVEQSKIGNIKAGESAELFVKYKNISNQNFTKKNVSLNIYSINAENFYNTSWATKKRPALISGEAVEHGQEAEFRFKIKAPNDVGNYKIAFRPVYFVENGFKWLGDDVARWQFNVINGNDKIIAPLKLAPKIDDVIVKGVEYDESQEGDQFKKQENTADPKQENNEDYVSKIGGVNDKARKEEIKETKKQDNNLVANKAARNFILVGGDGTPPEKVVLTFPSEIFYLTNQNHIILIGQKAKDAFQIIINLNNQEIILENFIDESNWQYEIALVEGENKISLIAQDSSKNRSESVILNIVSDSVSPQAPVVLTNNGDDFITGWQKVNLAGSKEDDVNSVFVNGDEAEIIDNNNWQIELNLEEGENLFEIFAKDLAGNSSGFLTLKVNRDSDLLKLNLIGKPLIATNQTSAEFIFEIGVAVENFYCQIDSEYEAACVSPFFVENLTEGQHQFNLRTNSNQINPIFYQWMIDATPPTCEVGNLNSEQQTENFNLAINSQDNFGVKSWNVEYQADGGEWQTFVSDSTDNVIEFIGEDGKFYGFRCLAVDEANNLSIVKDEADATTAVNLPPSVVINELAWMGTSADANDEWIELYNNTNHDIDLAGWVLSADDGTPNIELNKVIPANGYFLLERTDDTTVTSITADLIYTGALNNSGEYLRLKNSQDEVVDEVNCNANWFAGDNNTKAAMERVSSFAGGLESNNWQTNNGTVISGSDADGNPILGTPRAKNSVLP